jgi:serine kinase of HPr protein (carbohydrate metabolism regulator)
MSKITVVKEAAEKAMSAENDRTKHLLGRAEKFIAGTIIVTGFQLLNIATLLGSSSQWAKVSFYVALAALSLSLFFGLCSMGLKSHAVYPRGDKLWENLKPEEVSESVAEQAIIQLLLKTREQNAKLNDAKVVLLFWCGWLFFVGFLSVISSHLLDALANM